MASSFQIADCPFCVRENADNIKRLGYGASCKPATIDNCSRHKMAIDQYLGSWNGGWYPQGSSIQNMVLNGWGSSSDTAFMSGGSGTAVTPFWSWGNGGSNSSSNTNIPIKKFMCSHCRAVNTPSNNADPNGLVQYCMACGHNTFGKWVRG